MSSTRALVTGLAGFTGHYLALELAAAGYEVHGLGARGAATPNFHQIDLTDTEGLRRIISAVQPEVVVHLAAISFVGHDDPEAFYRVNVIGTRNLLTALADTAKNLDCVLLASSANIYGNSNGGIIGEEQPANPENDYAVSKLAMEYMARLWEQRLPLVMVRPFNYTGVGQTERFLLPKIVGHFRRKAKRIELGNLDVWRDFSDVRAVAAAYLGLIKAKPIGQVFNVCSGQATSLREAISLVEEIAGYKIEVTVNPAYVRPNEVKTLTGSADRLHAVLPNWKALPLRQTLSWMYEAP